MIDCYHDAIEFITGVSIPTLELSSRIWTKEYSQWISDVYAEVQKQGYKEQFSVFSKFVKELKQVYLHDRKDKLVLVTNVVRSFKEAQESERQCVVLTSSCSKESIQIYLDILEKEIRIPPTFYSCKKTEKSWWAAALKHVGEEDRERIGIIDDSIRVLSVAKEFGIDCYLPG